MAVVAWVAAMSETELEGSAVSDRENSDRLSSNASSTSLASAASEAVLGGDPIACPACRIGGGLEAGDLAKKSIPQGG